MLLVYSHKITPRLKYTFKQICTRILQLPVQFTTTVEEFIAHDSLKMSYSKQPLGSEFHIRSHDLLFEQGVTDVDINVLQWDNTKAFFTTNERSDLPFDIFAASFYLLSRYEEYLPHVKDAYGRFTATESLAYKSNFLKQPVVDIWAFKFRAALQERFQAYTFLERRFNLQPIIDVPMAFKYKKKGIMRSIGGTVKDVVTFNFKNLYQRYLVLFNFKKDPYNTFNWVINMQKQYKVKFLLFFLIGTYSTYDKNININKRKFVSLIKSVADYCNVGLKVSYLVLNNLNGIKAEKQAIENVINTDLKQARQSYNKLNLPDTYRHLIELEINEDYTMGYVNDIGFRAGTCTSFLFYDLDYETQTPLKVCPFQLIDAALLPIESFLDKQQTIMRLVDQVKQVQGTFTFVFHNYTFSDETQWDGFRQLFKELLNTTND